MQNANIICVPNHVVNISATNRPFNNSFVQTNYVKTMRTRNGRNAFVVIVTCTADSMEPGRMYCCVYTTKGTLLSCYTLN
jgi:hypothetical protein